MPQAPGVALEHQHLQVWLEAVHELSVTGGSSAMSYLSHQAIASLCGMET